jgi:hypothetical protein
VNDLVREGLKLSNIYVTKADLRKSYTASKLGVVVATLKANADKQAVMKAKFQLQNSYKYSKVYIHLPNVQLVGTLLLFGRT